MLLDALVVLAFLAAAAALGARARRREGLDDFVLASRALTLPQFVATLVPTFYGGVLGVGEFTWTSGLSNWTVMAAPYYAFAAVYALWLAERVRARPGLTIADHLESAYGRRAALAGAGLVFLLAAPADELLMAGTLLSRLTGLGVAAAMLAAGAAALAAVWRGGLRGDVASNRLQIVVMFAGFGLVLPYAVRAVGGPAALAAKLPPGHLSWSGGMSGWKILGWWLIAAWTIVDPAFHQRCAAAESPAVARRGILVSIAFWAVFDLMTTAAGLYARAALPNLSDATFAFPALADATMPALARGLFFAGLSASIFAALQAKSLLAAVSLGRDFAARLRPTADAARESARVRVALVAAAALSFALARLVPSVVDLWYAVGSAVIPGLLLPMLGVYAPRLRVSGAWALAASLGGFAASLAWVVAARRLGAAPLGLEPPFPGLALSAAIWAAGLYGSTSAAQQAPTMTPQQPQ